MRVSKINNNVNFGLKIVDNATVARIMSFHFQRGRTSKDMEKFIKEIHDLHNDEISLELSDEEERKTEVFGTVPFCNARIFGNMDTNTGKKYVDATTDYKLNAGSEYYFLQYLNGFIKDIQKDLCNK